MAGIQAGTAYIPVKADMSSFGREVQTGTKQATGKLKTFAKSTAGLIGGAFAAKKVKDFFGASIAGAREAIEIDKQTQAVIKSTGGAAGITADHIDKLSNKLQKQQTISDEVVQGGANLLLTFKNLRNEAGDGNDVFDRTVALAGDMSVAMGTDMKSSSILLGKALNDPKAGLSALTRVGVTFTDQQKEQITSLTEQGDVLGAQKVIMGEVESQFQGSAAAQADAGKKMSLAWADFTEVIGRMLIPIVDKLLGFLTKIAAWAAENPTKMKIIAGVIGGALVLAFAAWAIAATSAAIATIAAAAPVLAIGAAIAALVVGIYYVWNNWQEIWGKIRDFVGDALGKVVGFVKDLPGKAASALSAAWSALSDVWSKLFAAAKDFVSDRIADVVGFIGGLPGRAMAALSAAWSVYWEFYTTIFRAVATFVSDRIADIVGFFSAFPGRIRDAVVGAWQTFWTYYTGIAHEVRQFILDRIEDIVGYFTELPGRLVTAVEKGAQKLIDVGGWVIKRFLEGVEKIKALGAWFTGLPRKLGDWVMEGASKIVELGRKIIEKIIEGIKAAGGGLSDAILGAIPGGGGISFVLDKVTGDGPGAPPGGGGKALARVQSALGPGTYITSTYRTPAHNRRVGGSPTSYHMDRNNPAVDIGGSFAALNRLAPKLKAMGGWREFLWRVKGHYDHIHVAHSGGYVTPQGIAPLRRDELMTKLQVGETVLPKDFDGSIDTALLRRLVAAAERTAGNTTPGDPNIAKALATAQVGT